MSEPAKKIVLSGLRPTGRVHLGNYWGAVKNWVDLQEQYACRYFVADLHALTTDYADTSAIRESTLEEHVTSIALRRLVLSAHRRVADAIRAKDAGAARRRMERHVKAYSTTIAEERVRPAPALRPEESRA